MYLLGIDIGTSGTKTVLFSAIGEVIASSTVEYPLYSPQNGYAEQDPADWWNACVNSTKSVLAQSKINPKDIKGIGLSGQMHGLVMLDADGEVIRRSLIWCDQRTKREVAEITQKVGADRLIEITANPAITGFTAAKILWVKNNEPDNYNRCRKLLLPKDYIRYMLTGEFATEVSDASGMQLLDIPRREWSDEILEKLGIDKGLLAKVYESLDITGEINSKAAGITGLAAGTIVVGGAGDNAAAAVGTGVVVDGKAFTTIGSSGVVFSHTSDLAIDKKGRVHTFCCAIPGAWHVMGVTQAAGLSLKWFRDNFCGSKMEAARLMGVDPYVLMNEEVANTPIGANKLFYLPYLNGERTPHLDPNARGVFFGLTVMHTRAELIRAIMEGVSYSLTDCVEVMREMDISFTEMSICGGGAHSSIWRQMLADLYNCRVQTINSEEGPALGVAILAAVGAGIYKSVPEACEKIIKADKTQEPIDKNSQVYKNYYELYKSLYPALKDNYAKLAKL